ncbi:hypothetical protein AB0J86_27265 [Micromonospora sp. NPDC049559]|uniref:hypothetical protein n=1 Tax=Micromonospora sp. NPDC049559 TaxID=3155923 RepID=UPI003426EE0B
MDPVPDRVDGGIGETESQRTQENVPAAVPSAGTPAPRTGRTGHPAWRWLRAGRARDTAAVLSFVALAFWVTARLWLHPDRGLRSNPMDQAFFEWMLAHGARVLTHLDYPFVSYRMNVPDGINMMANTSVLAISLPLAPLTLLLGPRPTFNIFLTAALVATAVAWYFVLARHLVRSRFAAWIGALFCGFAPSMVSHANGHPNIVAQFLVPLIVWRTLRLRQHGRWLRNGVPLGLLIVWQAFINLEILLMTAIGLGVVAVVALLRRPEVRRDVRPFVAGLGVAAVVALVLLAYPLSVQFFGPQSYHGLPPLIRGYGADLGSFVAFSRESIGGDARTAKFLAQNPTEENAFFGWPLVVLVLALVVWLRHNIAVVGLAVTGLLFALLSLGPQIEYEGRPTGIPGPWRLVVNVPVLDSAVPTRWALAIAPVIGLLLAIGVDRAVELTRRYPRAAVPIRAAGVTMLAMALVPLVPTPLPAAKIAPTPAFVSSGAWRQYADGGRSVVTLPLPATQYTDPLRWSAQTGLDMPIPRGYFLGPDAHPDRRAAFGGPTRPSSLLFAWVSKSGKVPKLNAENRRELLTDLRFWRAGVVILAPQRNSLALRQTMTGLTGIQPTKTGGVWLWDIRPLLG